MISYGHMSAFADRMKVGFMGGPGRMHKRTEYVHVYTQRRVRGVPQPERPIPYTGIPGISYTWYTIINMCR